ASWMWGGAESAGQMRSPDPPSESVDVLVRKIYTPKAEIARALQKEMANRTGKARVRPQSVEAIEVGGQQALRCMVDGEGSRTPLTTCGFEPRVRQWSSGRVPTNS